MKGIRRYNDHLEKQRASARQEFITIGGNLRFWDWFKSQYVRHYRNADPVLKRGDCKGIATAAQYLSGKLVNIGFSGSEPFIIALKNLEVAFRGAMPVMWESESGELALPDIRLLTKCRIRSSERPIAASQGGRPPKTWALYYLVPGLVVYTCLLHGKPRWELIKRVIEEELDVEYGDVKRWWSENIKSLTEDKYFQKLDFQRKMRIYYSVYSYLFWSKGGKVDAWPEKSSKFFSPSPLLNKTEKRYCKIAIKCCPFLKKEILEDFFPKSTERAALVRTAGYKVYPRF